MILSKEDALDILWGDVDGYTKVEDKHFESGRWTEYRRLVVKEEATGKFWAVDYQQGLTELQYEQPFEYAEDHILFYEVEAKTVTKIKYVRVEHESL